MFGHASQKSISRICTLKFLKNWHNQISSQLKKILGILLATLCFWEQLLNAMELKFVQLKMNLREFWVYIGMKMKYSKDQKIARKTPF